MQTPRNRLVDFAVHHPKAVTITMVVVTLLLSALISLVKVDTDPENMLSEKEAVRVFHHQVKKDFDLFDVVVLGIVNESDPQGVFNPQTLARVAELSDFIRTLSWPDPEHAGGFIGVVKRNLISPDNVDSISQAGPGEIRFSWLMQKAPLDQAGADAISRLARENPLLNGTLVSEDGRALAIYIPITSKDLAYRVKTALEEKISTFAGQESYHITGLPVAEDTFGVEMFIQMAISAPLAMLLIFLLMLFFFKRLKLIVAPMIVAMVSVLCTMGLLIGSGNTLHIMSSMIPIFLMPIAVVDSIHILSEFFDQYQKTRNRETTIRAVIGKLFSPMLYTSLTSAAGFLSLTMTPIPPVQVFGLFVGFGILLAWVLTMLFVPAYVMLLQEESLSGFGQLEHHDQASLIHRLLAWMSGFTLTRAKLIVTVCLILSAVAAYGISLIRINDNPVKWFTKSHPIRVADRVLNQHFGGTYEAYLVVDAAAATAGGNAAIWQAEFNESLDRDPKLTPELKEAGRQLLAAAAAAAPTSRESFLKDSRERFLAAQEKEGSDAAYEAWFPLLDQLDAALQEKEIFKNPEVLLYLEKLQAELAHHPVVGKSNSVVDLVKKVRQELVSGRAEDFRVPESRAAVAQCLISFQNSHKPEDLWHLVTPDYRRANLWVQLSFRRQSGYGRSGQGGQ